MALDDALVNAHSIAEAEAADALRDARVPEFELNVPVVDSTGQVVGVADVLWRSLRAIGEIQSREFHLNEASWNASMARHNLLTRHALAVSHWPPSAIRRDPRGWAKEVVDWLRRRATELDMPYIPGKGARRPPPGGPSPFFVS